MASTLPLALTAAISGSRLVNIPVSAVVFGLSIACSVFLLPTSSVTSLKVSLILIAGGPTYTLHLNTVSSFAVLSLRVTVTVASPTLSAESLPDFETLTMLSSLDLKYAF